VAEVIETVKQKKGAVSQFVRETREEMQKVSFPSANDVRGTTVIVIINVIFFAIFLLLIDRLWTYVLEGIVWFMNWLFAAL
jgi:preprotein translocase SecE subunit